MKIFVEINHLAATASRAELIGYIHALEGAGATGVCVSDHLFVTPSGDRRAAVQPECDPLTTLAAVAAVSEHLELQTIVANTAWIHPGLLLRQFAQLALLADGERVTAGLGAGWNAEELESLGMSLAPFRQRAERLEEVLSLARQLFDSGIASLGGCYVTARDLPLCPRPKTAPRLLVGGGSDKVAELAGRFADVIDLQGHPRFGKVVGTVAEQQAVDARRRALTTVDDLAERMALVRSSAQAARRNPDAVTASVQIAYVAYGTRTDVEVASEALLANWAQLPPHPLDKNPFVLLGEPRSIADALRERAERFGLDRVSLGERNDVAAAPSDPMRFCRDVGPLLD